MHARARGVVGWKADGTVTQAERKRLHQLQSRTSKDICKQKHDAQTAKP